jgi:hypothetical protein
MNWQVYLHSATRRGVVVNVEAESAIEAAAAAWAKRGRSERPLIVCIEEDNVFLLNGEKASVSLVD